MQFNQAPAPRESSLGDAYDPTASYSVNDLCIHDNVLYKCTTAISGGEAWNSEHWTETNIGDEISALNSNFSNLFALLTGCGEPNTMHDTGISCGISGYGTIKVYTYVGSITMEKDTIAELYTTSTTVRPLMIIGTIKSNNGNVEYSNGTYVSFGYDHTSKELFARQVISGATASYYVRCTFVYADLI